MTPGSSAKYTPQREPLHRRGRQRLIEFLVDVFGGTERRRILRADGRIDHGDVRIGDSLVMLSEASETYPARPYVSLLPQQRYPSKDDVAAAVQARSQILRFTQFIQLRLIS